MNLTNNELTKVIEAGDAMHKRLGSNIDFLDIHAKALAMGEREAWQSAKSAAPAPQPAVDRLVEVGDAMEAVDDWLHAMFPDSKHMRHPLGSPYRTDQAAQDALRARLTAKASTKPMTGCE